MAMFKGFKPQGMQKIANKLGYRGSLEDFDNFLDQNPEKKRQMISFEEKAQEMAKGGVIKAQTGTLATNPRVLPQQNIPQSNITKDDTIGSVATKRALTPGLPSGATTVPVGTQLSGQQLVGPAEGQVSGTIAVPTAMASTTMAQQQDPTQAAVVDAQGVAEQVNTSLDTLQAAQTTEDDPRSQVLAAQQTASSVGNLSSAQGNAILMTNPVQRQIQTGELIDGVANAEKASKYTEQIEAATATASDQATVQGQLATLTANFDATNPPS